MASGGFLGKVISAPFKAVSSILGMGGGGGAQVRASETVYPTVTGRDLVTSTEAQQPQSAVMGEDTDTLYGTKKKRGTASLYVKPNNNSGSSSYTGRSGF